jgi:hypothetical protein
VIALAFAVAVVVVAMGILPGDKGIAPCVLARAVAAMFVGEEVGVCAIVGVAWREFWSNKLYEYLG